MFGSSVVIVDPDPFGEIVMPIPLLNSDPASVLGSMDGILNVDMARYWVFAPPADTVPIPAVPLPPE